MGEKKPPETSLRAAPEHKGKELTRVPEKTPHLDATCDKQHNTNSKVTRALGPDARPTPSAACFGEQGKLVLFSREQDVLVTGRGVSAPEGGAGHGPDVPRAAVLPSQPAARSASRTELA